MRRASRCDACTVKQARSRTLPRPDQRSWYWGRCAGRPIPDPAQADGPTHARCVCRTTARKSSPTRWTGQPRARVLPLSASNLASTRRAPAQRDSTRPTVPRRRQDSTNPCSNPSPSCHVALDQTTVTERVLHRRTGTNVIHECIDDKQKKLGPGRRCSRSVWPACSPVTGIRSTQMPITRPPGRPCPGAPGIRGSLTRSAPWGSWVRCCPRAYPKSARRSRCSCWVVWSSSRRSRRCTSRLEEIRRELLR